MYASKGGWCERDPASLVSTKTGTVAMLEGLVVPSTVASAFHAPKARADEKCI